MIARIRSLIPVEVWIMAGLFVVFAILLLLVGP